MCLFNKPESHTTDRIDLPAGVLNYPLVMPQSFIVQLQVFAHLVLQMLYLVLNVQVQILAKDVLGETVEKMCIGTQLVLAEGACQTTCPVYGKGR